MKEIMIDLQNYEEDGSVFRRIAVRGIVHKDGKYLIISSKYGDHKFPGGGMKSGEDLNQTLNREMQEETGYKIIPGTIRDGFLVHERRKGNSESLMEMESYYFFCDVEQEAGQQKLDWYEKEYDYKAKWLPLEEIIRRNEAVKADDKIPWIERETLVMKEVLQLQNIL